MSQGRLTHRVILGLLLCQAFSAQVQAQGTDIVYTPAKEPVFSLHYVPPGKEEMMVEGVFELNPTMKENMVTGLEYWTEILGKGTDTLRPIYVGTMEDANASAGTFYYTYAEGHYGGRYHYSDYYYGNNPIEDEEGVHIININIGKYLGQPDNSGNYGWAFLPTTNLALNGWQADYLCTIRHELGHALGIYSNRIAGNITNEDGETIQTIYFFNNIYSPWNDHLINENKQRPEAETLIAPTKEDAKKYADLLREYAKGTMTQEEYDELIETAFVGTKLWFTGDHVSEVLNGKTFDGIAGIPVNSWEGSGAFLRAEFSHLQLGMMSHAPYCNYTTFTESDLAVMQDLGYNIDRKKYYGFSVYNDELIYENNLPYYARNQEGTDYLKDTYSTVPLGVGLHIYGSKNQITQSGDILTAGAGAVGIRVDGTDNTLTVAANTKVHSNGENGFGILVANGKDQVINQLGEVQALGQGGIGARLDFGSSSNGWVDEYRGSYIRFSRLQRESAYGSSNLSLADNPELTGPMVKEYNLSNTLTGKEAALYIGTNTYVKDINVAEGAALYGDIISRWNPNLTLDTYVYTDNKEDTYVYEKDLPVVQYDGDRNSLTTNLNFTSPKLTYTGDIDSRIGNIETGMDIKNNLGVAGVNEISSTINLNIKPGAELTYSGTAHVLSTNVEDKAKLYLDGAYLDSSLFSRGTLAPVGTEASVITGDLESTGFLGVNAEGTLSKPLVVEGNAKVEGTLVPVTGAIYLPNTKYEYLTAASYEANVANKAGDVFRGLFDVAEVTADAKSGSITLDLGNPERVVGPLSPVQQRTWYSLSSVAMDTSIDRTAAAHVLNLEDSQVGGALTALAGGPQLEVTKALQADGTLGRSLNRRFRDVTSGNKLDQYSIWGNVAKNWQSGYGTHADGHSSTMVLGVDKPWSTSWRGGLVVGAGDATLTGSSYGYKAKTLEGGIYGLYAKGPSEAEAFFTYGQHRIEGDRYVGGLAAHSDYTAQSLRLGGEYRQDLDYAKQQTWHKKVFGGINMTRFSQEDFKESGSIGCLGQQLEGAMSFYSSATVGLEAEAKLKGEDYLRFRVGYKRALSGTNPELKYTIAKENISCLVPSEGADKDFLVLGASGKHNLGEGWSLGGDLWLEKSSHQQNLSLGVKVEKSF